MIDTNKERKTVEKTGLLTRALLSGQSAWSINDDSHAYKRNKEVYIYCSLVHNNGNTD